MKQIDHVVDANSLNISNGGFAPDTAKDVASPEVKKAPNKAFAENNPWSKSEYGPVKVASAATQRASEVSFAPVNLKHPAAPELPEPPEESNSDSTDNAVDVGRRSLVTGNGHGYAVLSEKGEISKFYAHPYRFERPNADPSKEGVPTLNYLQGMSWRTGAKPEDSSATKIRTSYLSESNIMSVAGAKNQQQYFMPFGLPHNALITTIQGINGGDVTQAKLTENWSKPVAKEEKLSVAGREVKLVSFIDTPESVAMVSLDKAAPDSATSAPERGWAIMSLENKDQLSQAVTDLDAWQNKLSPLALSRRELKDQDSWRVKPDVTFQTEAEKRVWRQSETILRMGQIAEENTDVRKNSGLINASLPEGEWFIPWVRDMSYSINALTEMGHTTEARKGLVAYFNADPGRMQKETRGKDYQVSVVRYFGNGAEEADYSGEKTPNVEFDNWGLVLSAAGEYYQKTHDKSFLDEQTQRGSIYQSMRDFVVAPLLANLDKQGDGSIVTADSSLWEEHQENKKHFAFTTIAAIHGLREFLPMAEAMNDKDTLKKVNETISNLEKGFESAFVDQQKALRGSLEPSFAHDADGALLEAFNYDVEKDPKVLENTLKKMELLREPSGGFRRVRGDSNYERQEFLMINFYMSRLYFKLGRDKEGMQLLDQMVQRADQDKGRVPEMYVSERNDEFPGPIGKPTGAIPMVGYGAGAYVSTLEEREKERRANETNVMR